MGDVAAVGGGVQESPRRFLYLAAIVLAQFAGTSVWFASNGVLDDIREDTDIPESALSYTSSAVQFGFILGTLTFSLLAVADRVAPRLLFCASALLAGLSNLGTLVAPYGLGPLLLFRVLTGFFLAGVYPVGMKICATWFQARELGIAIGFLVGALVLGTALPQLLGTVDELPSWEAVIGAISVFAILGGLLILLVPAGPYLKRGGRAARVSLSLHLLGQIFAKERLRLVAFGYFGHMWELYSFWSFVPELLDSYQDRHGASFSTGTWAFIIIASGALSSSLGGVASLHYGSGPTAFVNLAISGLCCVFSPLAFGQGSSYVYFGFLILWGLTVIPDSPQFSALVAKLAPRGLVGTALTVVNCIGFALTIPSIQITSALHSSVPARWVLLHLAIGPAIGLYSTFRLLRLGPEEGGEAGSGDNNEGDAAAERKEAAGPDGDVCDTSDQAALVVREAIV